MSSTEVFWLINGRNQNADGRIIRAPLSGGPGVELAAGQALPWELEIDDRGLWWTNSGTSAGLFRDGALMFAPLDGGPPQVIAAGQPSASGLAVSSDAIYWRTRTTLNRMTLPGGAAEVLADDGTTVGWKLALDERNLYSTLSRGIQATSLDGGLAQVLATDQASPRPIVVRDGLVFWTNLGDRDDATGSVLMTPTAGGAPTVAAAGVDTGFGLAVDDRHIYWSGGGPSAGEYQDGMVMRCPRAGCGECNEHLEVLACEQFKSFRLVIDQAPGGSVYWTTGDGVWSLTK